MIIAAPLLPGGANEEEIVALDDRPPDELEDEIEEEDDEDEEDADEADDGGCCSFVVFVVFSTLSALPPPVPLPASDWCMKPLAAC